MMIIIIYHNANRLITYIYIYIYSYLKTKHNMNLSNTSTMNTKIVGVMSTHLDHQHLGSTLHGLLHFPQCDTSLLAVVFLGGLYRMVPPSDVNVGL